MRILAQCGRMPPAEAATLRLLAMGLSNTEIAARMSVGVQTVKNRTWRVFERFGVKSRAGLLALFVDYACVEAAIKAMRAIDDVGNDLGELRAHVSRVGVTA